MEGDVNPLLVVLVGAHGDVKDLVGLDVLDHVVVEDEDLGKIVT